MPEFWVGNASPVITLAKAGHLDLLTQLADDVLVPEAVLTELLDAPADDPARQAMERGWGTRIPGVTIPVGVLEWGLGAGEASVLAATLQHREHTAVLDDAQGRKCARALDIPVIGTLGIVLRWPDDYKRLVERRMALIESNKSINLIEQPECKRRWSLEPWDEQEKRALRH